ncbi:MAG: HupE/UreJ family protein [Actinomycetota bacterium]|nr:HupE/UreJ family protein [Actinomycetota bacterium]
MVGLDERIASFSDGTSIWIVLAAAVLLGLRHATDPDHVAAVATLVAGSRDGAARRAGELGLAWGVGHGVTLFVFGLPILLLNGYLPERVQQTAETAVALVIVYLAVRLLVRWRRGAFRPHAHPHAHGARTRAGAFAIGLVHGVGGSAGVGVLILASVESTAQAVVSLLVLAVFTAVSMGILSTGFGRTLVSRPLQAAFNGVAPALAVASLAFGVWYASAAWQLAPYPF